jgi:Domain of unknown function (DUF4760)
MVKCLTDFSCWETIAKLAPIGTALIVLIAAIIALGAMWVQMHIARRRASIDFFLKTEMDKTVIDLYNKFKANAPVIAFVPDPSDLTRSDYNDTRALLNICELIAVGVNKGAFSKSVSEAYWGDIIPDAYQTAKQLINNIRTTPGEGSRYTYVNLEKLAKRWAKRNKKATSTTSRARCFTTGKSVSLLSRVAKLGISEGMGRSLFRFPTTDTRRLLHSGVQEMTGGRRGQDESSRTCP